MITSPMLQLKQKYAIVLGNHDVEGDLSAKEIFALDSTHPYSLT
jgi:hypothetical protein